MLNLSVIITLYKTPSKQLLNLKNYKGLKILIANQTPDRNLKKKLIKLFGKKLKYYQFKENIGLSKSSNFLLKKVKTKYCLFTQADINISKKNIEKLYKFMIKNKFICVGPNILTKKKDKIKLGNKRNNEIVKKLDASILMMDTKKLKKTGFFDNDFFLYWEDIMLMKKINATKNKMAKLNNVSAFHLGESSTEKNFKIDFIRWNNYRYGEYLYDYKTKNLKFIKIVRRLISSIILIVINILSFNLRKINKLFAEIVGILKFVGYLMKKYI